MVNRNDDQITSKDASLVVYPYFYLCGHSFGAYGNESAWRGSLVVWSFEPLSAAGCVGDSGDISFGVDIKKCQAMGLGSSTLHCMDIGAAHGISLAFAFGEIIAERSASPGYDVERQVRYA